MHVLFEGVLHLEVKLMLKHFIVDMGYFTLETLNSRMESFAYSRKESTNHSHQCILLEKESCHFQVTIVYKRCWCTVSLFIEQSLAAQMWTFVILLPLLVGTFGATTLGMFISLCVYLSLMLWRLRIAGH